MINQSEIFSSFDICCLFILKREKNWVKFVDKIIKEADFHIHLNGILSQCLWFRWKCLRKWNFTRNKQSHIDYMIAIWVCQIDCSRKFNNVFQKVSSFRICTHPVWPHHKIGFVTFVLWCFHVSVEINVSKKYFIPRRANSYDQNNSTFWNR